MYNIMYVNMVPIKIKYSEKSWRVYDISVFIKEPIR